VAAARAGLPRGTVLDGELIVFDHDAPNFERVRRRLTLDDPRKIARAVTGERAVFMAFDLLFTGGESLLRVPFEERRAQLEESCPEGGHLALSPRFENGPALFEAVCAQGLEGIIAKRRDSLYLPGKRSCAWVKCKTCAAREVERHRRDVWFH
jgi:ATP-dependent DNA ligase